MPWDRTEWYLWETPVVEDGIFTTASIFGSSTLVWCSSRIVVVFYLQHTTVCHNTFPMLCYIGKGTFGGEGTFGRKEANTYGVKGTCNAYNGRRGSYV